MAGQEAQLTRRSDSSLPLRGQPEVCLLGGLICFNVKQKGEMFLRLQWAAPGGQTYFYSSDGRQRNLGLEKARGVNTLGQCLFHSKADLGREGVNPREDKDAASFKKQRF